MSIIIDALNAALPHGSGVNMDWTYTLTNRGGSPAILAANGFHCLNDNGMYDGWATFHVIIPIETPVNFYIQFTGHGSHYRNKKYQLKDLLESLIHEAIKDLDLF